MEQHDNNLNQIYDDRQQVTVVVTSNKADDLIQPI